MPIEPMDLNQEPNNDKPLTSYEIMVKMAKAIEEMAVAISLISERMDSIEKAIAMPQIQIRPTPPANGWGDLLRNDPWQTTIPYQQPYIYPVSSGTTTTTYTDTSIGSPTYITAQYSSILRDVEQLSPVLTTFPTLTVDYNQEFDAEYDDDKNNGDEIPF
jgi:hypothetical protein